MRRILTTVVSTIGVVILTASAVIANPGDRPPDAGAVTRMAAPGTQFLFDASAALGSEQVPMVATFNVASVDKFCDQEPAGAGQLQVVTTPSGHTRYLLHDDVPVMIFDATGLGSTHAEVFPVLFPAICRDGLQPIATGTATVRNQVAFNGTNETFQHVFDATGHVTDGTQSWSLSAHRRAKGELPLTGPPASVADSLRLAARGG